MRGDYDKQMDWSFAQVFEKALIQPTIDAISPLNAKVPLIFSELTLPEIH